MNNNNFIIKNFPILLKDIIQEYELEFVSIDDSSLALIGRDYIISILFHHYYGNHIFYIFKDNETDEYVSIDPLNYLKTKMNYDKINDDREIRRIKIVNEDYYKFIHCLPHKMKCCIELYEIYDILHYLFKLKNLQGDLWLDDYFKNYSRSYKHGVSEIDREIISKYLI